MEDVERVKFNLVEFTGLTKAACVVLSIACRR